MTMMTTQEQYIAKIKQLVIKRFGSNISSADDCVALSDAVEKEVGIRIDMPTLQMLFSRNSRVVTPRPMVLSALAKYVGYTGWSDFCATCNINGDDDNTKIPVYRRWGVIAAVCVAVVVVVAGVLLFVGRGGDEPKKSDAPTAYDHLVENVADDWLVRTKEHYLELRIYDGVNNLAFDKHVAEFYEEFTAGLTTFIANDIRTKAAEKGLDISGEDVNASAKSVANRCIAIIDELRTNTPEALSAESTEHR